MKRMFYNSSCEKNTIFLLCLVRNMCCMSALGSIHSSLSRLFTELSPSHLCYDLVFKATQKLFLDIDASVFVLLSSFCAHAEGSGNRGNSNLKTSITLPFPSAYSLFSTIMQGQLFWRSKGELVFILRFEFARRVSSRRVRA